MKKNNLGLVHIYCGEGKGKTTCSVGLTVRAAGYGLRVLFMQFLKSGDSSELKVLRQLPEVTVFGTKPIKKFSFQMTEEEKAAERVRQTELLHTAFQKGASAQLLVLDEVCAALSTGMLSLSEVLTGLDELPPETEVVLTGRDPALELLERAHYITEMVKRRHPYDSGISARPCVEF